MNFKFSIFSPKSDNSLQGYNWGQ